jgi:hypothetical protein
MGTVMMKTTAKQNRPEVSRPDDGHLFLDVKRPELLYLPGGSSFSESGVKGCPLE